MSLYVYIYIRHSQFVTPRLRKSHAGASCIIRAGRLRNIHGRFAQHLRPVCALFVDKGQCKFVEECVNVTRESLFSVLSTRKHSRSSLTLATPYMHASSLATTVTAHRIYDERGWKSKCHGQPFSHDVMGHYYYGIIIHTCAVTSNNISLCALLLSEALLHLMYALVLYIRICTCGSYGRP